MGSEAMKIPRRKNPVDSEKLWWLWLFLFPIAFVLWLHFYLKEDRRIWREKQRIKEQKFEEEDWEYEFWIDDDEI